MHLCMGDYGEHSSRLRNFEGFKLVTNLKETKEAKCNIGYGLLGRRDSACVSEASDLCMHTHMYE